MGLTLNVIHLNTCMIFSTGNRSSGLFENMQAILKVHMCKQTFATIPLQVSLMLVNYSLTLQL